MTQWRVSTLNLTFPFITTLFPSLHPSPLEIPKHRSDRLVTLGRPSAWAASSQWNNRKTEHSQTWCLKTILPATWVFFHTIRSSNNNRVEWSVPGKGAMHDSSSPRVACCPENPRNEWCYGRRSLPHKNKKTHIAFLSPHAFFVCHHHAFFLLCHAWAVS